MTNRNKVVFTIGLIFSVLGFVAVLKYRPWIIINDYNDFGINEFSPSFFYTLGLCLIGASISKKQPKKTMIFIILGSAAYELEQLFTDRYFDYKDLVSIGIALLIGLFLYGKIGMIISNTKN